MAAINITSGEIAAGLLEPGFGLGANQFTFSIPTTGSTWPRYDAGSEPFTGYSILNGAQATAFRAALASWDELIARDFTEVADNATTRGEVRIAFSDVGADTAGYAYSGNPQNPGGLVGDIWLSDDYASLGLARGSYQYEVLIHEIGHTLGFKHSFEAPALPAAFDSTRYTVLSYNTAANGEVVTFTRSGGSIRASFDNVVAATPMVLDIAAAQQLYGADTKTRSGETRYTFTQGEAVLQSIYDAGGADTIDLSNFTRSNVVDLTPGSYSSIGQYGIEAQIAQWTAQFPTAASFIRDVLTKAELFTFTDNLGIAFGTVIENVRGGSAADRISGNDVANMLDGGGGDDVLDGGHGVDRLLGQGGNDTLTGGAGGDIFVFGTSGSGTDRITDFAAAEDRFDLGGANFTAANGNGGGTLLTYSGGTIQVDGASGLSLAQWNALVNGGSGSTSPPPPNPVPANANFFLLVPAGAAATVQGSGTVFGAIGSTQAVTVLDTPGRIAFDGSFNAGGDRIVLAGAASRYTVSRSGATVEISDGDTNVTVAAGTIGADIVFADGVRSLSIDAGAVRIGAQLLTATAAPLTASAGPAIAIGATSTGVASQLLVNAGGVATASGLTSVFGTVAGQETVTVASGAQLTFGGSFNAGGDRIVLGGAASTWTVARSGATVSLAGPNGESVAVPVGQAGMTIAFADGGRTLVFDAAAGAIKLGSMTIGTTPTAITGAATAEAEVSRLAFAEVDRPVDIIAPADPIQVADAGLMPTIG